MGSGPDLSPGLQRRESSPGSEERTWRTGRGPPSLVPLSCSSPEAIAWVAPLNWTHHTSSLPTRTCVCTVSWVVVINGYRTKS